MTPAITPLSASPSSALTVLVADDIAESRAELEQLVRSLGHHCITAASGEEALLVAQSPARPDLLLLDLLMPYMDGFEVTRQLREHINDRWLPVIVTSGLQGEEHFIRALEQGADDYLERPINPALLGARLRHYQRVLALQSRVSHLAERQVAIHEHIRDAVITVDGSGLIREANLAAREWFGGGSALSGRHLAEVVGANLGALMSATELELTVVGGQRVPMAVSVGSWSIGGEHSATLALHDLTEQRRIERMKEEFLATVSHELRTPLTSIVGALGLLGAGAAGALPGPAQDLVGVARRNGERLGRLIDDVLDLTKLEGKRMTLHPRSAEIGALVAESVRANQGYAQRSDVVLHYEAAAAPAARALVDVDRFLQVMANLLSNAIKHSPQGASVDVVLRGDAGGWRVDVRDHGPGIDPAFRQRLFDKFAQADGSDRRAVGGTGLGLYITRMLVERMNGRILVQSEPGHGATFSVVLPAHGTGSAWLLCIARDRQRQQRLAEWLAPVVRVECVSDLAGARDCVARNGPAALVLADPEGEGRADRFCDGLRELGLPTVLTGDSIDAAFAARQRMPWVPAQAGRQPLLDTVRERLDALAPREQHDG